MSQAVLRSGLLHDLHGVYLSLPRVPSNRHFGFRILLVPYLPCSKMFAATRIARVLSDHSCSAPKRRHMLNKNDTTLYIPWYDLPALPCSAKPGHSKANIPQSILDETRQAMQSLWKKRPEDVATKVIKRANLGRVSQTWPSTPRRRTTMAQHTSDSTSTEESSSMGTFQGEAWMGKPQSWVNREEGDG